MKTGFRAIHFVFPALFLFPAGCNQGSLEAERKAWSEDRQRLEQDLENARTALVAREKQLQEHIESVEKAARQEQENLIKQIDQERENTHKQIERGYLIERELVEAKAMMARAGISLQPKDGQAPPDSRAEAAKKKESMVTIEGEGSKGLGVLVKEDGKLWLYTAAHVLGGQTKLTITAGNGNKITKFGQLQVAGERDLVRLEVQEADGLAGLEWVPADRVLREQMSLFVLADGEPQGASIQGAPPGPGLPVPLTAGGSSPGDALVLDMNDAGLLGIVTRADVKRGELFPGMGGHAARMNNAFLRPLGDMEWKTVAVTAFLAEGRLIAEYDAMTRLAMAVSRARFAGGRVQFEALPGSGISPMQILEDNKKLPAVAQLLAWNPGEAGGAGKISPDELDQQRKVHGMLTSIAASVRQSGQNFDPAKFSGPHRILAQESAAWRATADQAMRDALTAVGKRP